MPRGDVLMEFLEHAQARQKGEESRIQSQFTHEEIIFSTFIHIGGEKTQQWPSIKRFKWNIQSTIRHRNY